MLLGKLWTPALLSLVLTACGSGRNVEQIPPDSVFAGVNFVGLAVADIERASAFYEDSVALGLADQWQGEQVGLQSGLANREPANAQMRLLRSTNAQLLLMEFEGEQHLSANNNPVEVYGPGIAHVCYQVNKETRAYQRFLEAGGKPIGSPDMVQINPRNPVTYAYAHDHDNAIVEIEHVDFSALDLPEPPKNNYRIRHVSLATPNMDRLVTFYAELLQQHEPRRVGSWLKLSGENLDKVSGQPGSEIEMAWFQIRNLELEIIQYHSHPTQLPGQPRALNAPGYNMIVLDVSSLEEARERFESAGGTIEGEATTFVGAPTLFGRDPDGNLIGMQVSTADATISAKNFANNGT